MAHIIISLALLPSIIFAQTADVHMLLRNLREGTAHREVVNRKNLIPKKTLTESRQEYQENRSQIRQECRKSIRRANRDERRSEILRCYRSQLTQDLTFLRKQSEVIEGIPGISVEVKNTAIARTEELTIATVAILNAIDSGVYETLDEVKEAKRNLFTLYRLPQLLSLNHHRADRTVSWIALLIQHLSVLLPENPDKTMSNTLEEGLLCLRVQLDLLQSVLDENDYYKSKRILSQSQVHLRSCIEALRQV